MRLIILLALVTMLFTGCNGYEKKESKDDSWVTQTWENSTTTFVENIEVENIIVEEIKVEGIKIK